MPDSIYSINVRKEPRYPGDTHPFVLYNGDVIAGDRLFKGDNKKARWPLKPDGDSMLPSSDCSWNRYRTQGKAFAAAELLQEYLEKTEKNK